MTERLEFRVLGRVQVAAGSRTVELASGKQVALLACLLIGRGEVVSRDRLIDALWGEQPPPSAVNSLQVLVHALRRRLGSERIEREGAGYRLRLAPGELDLERFELLVARGRAELGRGEAAAAAASLRAALALWRGQAYEEVGYEAFAQAEVARLAELRLAAGTISWRRSTTGAAMERRPSVSGPPVSVSARPPSRTVARQTACRSLDAWSSSRVLACLAAR